MNVDAVIPTFQETTRLFRAVESVKNQTYPVSKIWVIDDGSDKAVVDQIHSMFNADTQVFFRSLPHSGIPGKLREWAISQSTAEWIAFLDADDYWDKQKIEIQMELATRTKAEAVFSNALKVSDVDLGEYFPRDDFKTVLEFRDLVSDNKLINSSVVVAREKLLSIGTYCSSHNVRAVEDYATWLRVSTTTKFVGTAEPLTFYQISPGGLSRESHPDRRIFALSDFLLWRKERSALKSEFGLGHTWQRLRVLAQLIREFLL
jgi:glycosyltransferase involved in cell wall biosynthesis